MGEDEEVSIKEVADAIVKAVGFKGEYSVSCDVHRLDSLRSSLPGLHSSTQLVLMVNSVNPPRTRNSLHWLVDSSLYPSRKVSVLYPSFNYIRWQWINRSPGLHRSVVPQELQQCKDGKSQGLTLQWTFNPLDVKLSYALFCFEMVNCFSWSLGVHRPIAARCQSPCATLVSQLLLEGYNVLLSSSSQLGMWNHHNQ